VVGEVPFPQAGCEQVDLTSGVGINALEHVHEVDIRIDALQATRREQTLDNRYWGAMDKEPG
jgi:hypothetical protein